MPSAPLGETRTSPDPVSLRERLLAETERLAGAGSWEWNLETDEMRWSQQTCRMLGVPPTRTRTFDELLTYAHPDDRAKVEADIRECIARSRAYAAEFRVVRRDGGVRFVSARAELTGAIGGSATLVAVLHDVTDQAYVAKRLRVSEERLQIVTRATQDVVWDFPVAEGSELWLSESVRSFGYDVSRVPLAWWLERLHPSDHDAVESSFHEAIEGTSIVWSAEYRFRRADGTFADIFDRAYISRDALGAPVRVIGSMQEISARKDAERRQSTSFRALEEANRQLAEFAYVVSHDLKAPLRGISSLADWIIRDSKDRLDDEGRQQLELLLVRVHRMNDLVEGILRYSRVGRANEKRTSVALAELVPEVVDLLSAPPHVTVEIQGALPNVVGARTQLAQVFQNLVGNAVKFCDPACGRVLIACADQGDVWQFEIKDNGRGIEERHFDRIFQLFQTLTSFDKGGSTGIGLTIVKKIVESAGGRVWVESSIGEGSRFFFTLPKTSEH